MSFHPASSTERKGGFPTRPAGVFLSGITGMQMTAKKTYFEKLKDPRWQKKRLEALESAEWSCQSCYDNESTLHVHHKQYFKGREPWEYDLDQLAVLCESCHENQHEAEDILQVITSKVPIDGPGDRRECAYVLAGLIGVELEATMSAYLRSKSLGRLIALVPYGDAAQAIRLHEDIQKGRDSEILATIIKVIGEREEGRGYQV